MIALGKEEDYVVFYVFIGVYQLNFCIFIYFSLNSGGWFVKFDFINNKKCYAKKMNDKTMFNNVQGMLTINYCSSNIYKEIFRRMGVRVSWAEPTSPESFFSDS